MMKRYLRKNLLEYNQAELATELAIMIGGEIKIKMITYGGDQPDRVSGRVTNGSFCATIKKNNNGESRLVSIKIIRGHD